VGKRYDREAVDRLARAVLAGTELNERAGLDTRAELAQFDVVAAAFHHAPGRRVRRGSRRGEPLGFGVEDVVTAVAVLVLTIAKDAMTQVAEERTKGLVERLVARVRRMLPGRAPAAIADRTGEPADAPGGFTPEQLRRIQRTARRHARRMRVPAPVAEAIANAIIAELVTGAGLPEPVQDVTSDPQRPRPGGSVR
jgi:hypothetical protein